MGCLAAVFGFVLTILITACKWTWKLLRVLLFRCHLLFVALYLIAAGLIHWLWPAAQLFSSNVTWFYVGFALSIGLSIAAILFSVLRKERREAERRRR